MGTSRAACSTLVLALSLLLGLPAWALDVPPLEGRVNDRADLLSAETRRSLEKKLQTYERSTGHQFAVLIVPSLEGDPLEDYSIRVVEAWKLGRADGDDGLLLLIAVEDRQMRIEVGYGLEGAITDLLSSRIIRQVLVPAFRQNQFDEGVVAAMDLLMRAAEGENVVVPGRGASEDPLPPWLPLLAIFLIFGLPGLLGWRGRRHGWVYPMGMGGYRGGRGFGGGGFGGGGFSGGGGGFGGGGASGSW